MKDRAQQLNTAPRISKQQATYLKLFVQPHDIMHHKADLKKVIRLDNESILIHKRNDKTDLQPAKKITAPATLQTKALIPPFFTALSRINKDNFHTANANTALNEGIEKAGQIVKAFSEHKALTQDPAIKSFAAEIKMLNILNVKMNNLFRLINEHIKKQQPSKSGLSPQTTPPHYKGAHQRVPANVELKNELINIKLKWNIITRELIEAGLITNQSDFEDELEESLIHYSEDQEERLEQEDCSNVKYVVEMP